MYIQLFVIFLAIVGARIYSLESTPYNRERKRRNYVVFICILLILQSGLRHLNVGADTYGYFMMFEDVKKTGWTQIGQNFYDTYLLGEGKDAGYPLLEKVFQLLFSEYRTFLFAIAIFFFWTFGRFIYANTSYIRDILVVTCLYQVLFYGFFSVTGLRQTIATGFVLLGYEYVRKRKLLPFLFLILAGGLIHKSALLFLPFYFIARFKYSRALLIGAMVSLPVIFPLARRFAAILAEISASDTYMRYAESDFETAGARMFLVFMVIISLVCLFNIRSILNSKTLDAHPIINAFALGLMFTPLTWVDPSLMRVVQYYSIFTLLLLPMILNADILKDRGTRNIAIATVILLLCMVILRRNSDYAFLWEEMNILL